MIRLTLAFVLGFGLAYLWQHTPAQPPQPPCAQPVNVGPQLRDNLYWQPWDKVRKA